jgi:hypothetical protein
MKKDTNIIVSLKQKIRELEDKIRDLVEENSNLRIDWTLSLYIALDEILNNYVALLQPHEVLILASYQNKSEQYLIRCSDVLCLVSQGRYKKIILRNRISGIGSNERETDIVYTSETMDSLQIKLDGPRFHLARVNKSIFANVKYYDLVGQTIHLKESLQKSTFQYAIIKVTPGNISDFTTKKENYKTIRRYKNKLLVTIINKL